MALRRRTGWGADRLGAWLGLPASTCPPGPRAARASSAGRKAREPVVRYEHERAGQPPPPRHQEAGAHRGRPRAPRHRRPRPAPAGRRLGGPPRRHRRRQPPRLRRDPARRAEAARRRRFALRALRWFRDRGVRVLAGPHRQRLAPIAAGSSGRPCAGSASSTRRTRPYRPQTNGKVERWIRTVLSECLYLEVFASSRAAPPCARALHRLLQRGAPPPGHRRTDPAQRLAREAGRLRVSPTS